MIVYFDTVKRKRPVNEGGELIQMDWSSKRIINSLPIFPSKPDIHNDPNPRGNSRGGKGIIVSGDEILVGTYHTILVYDHHLNLKRTITNNLFVNIHEISLYGKNIWVSSTAIDCALLVTPEGEMLKSWWPREESQLQEKYGLYPMKIDKQADNRMKHIHTEMGQKPGHTHLNAVATFADHTYVLLNRLGVVVQIEPEFKIILEDPLIEGAHSLVISVDGKRMILCSSFKRDVLVYDVKNGTQLKRIHLLEFDEIARLYEENPDQPYNRSIFVRGLEIIDHETILVGVSPASILKVDIKGGKLLEFFQYSTNVSDAVHGLAHLPILSLK